MGGEGRDGSIFLPVLVSSLVFVLLSPISGTGIQEGCFFSCGPGRVEQVCQAAQIPRL